MRNFGGVGGHHQIPADEGERREVVAAFPVSHSGKLYALAGEKSSRGQNLTLTPSPFRELCVTPALGSEKKQNLESRAKERAMQGPSPSILSLTGRGEESERSHAKVL